MKIRNSTFFLFLCALTVTANLHAQQSAAAASPASPAAQSKRASDYLNEQLPRWLRAVHRSGIGSCPASPRAWRANSACRCWIPACSTGPSG